MGWDDPWVADVRRRFLAALEDDDHWIWPVLIDGLAAAMRRHDAIHTPTVELLDCAVESWLLGRACPCQPEVAVRWRLMSPAARTKAVKAVTGERRAA